VRKEEVRRRFRAVGGSLLLLASVFGILVWTEVVRSPLWLGNVLWVVTPTGIIVMFILGAILFTESIHSILRSRRLRKSGKTDSWDPKGEPAEYGPWRPGDP
jgi:vacuolar-type H+-ATPase subunit I/STV1